MIRIDDDVSRHALLGTDDDNIHPAAEHRWWHETAWFWWFVPEVNVGGWLYNWVRPNIGTSGGGCWVWDDSTFSHLEVPYYACYSNLEYDPSFDLRDGRYPSGVAVKCTEPLTRYELTFADRDMIDLDLTFDAVMPPWVAPAPGPDSPVHHLDQVGRVTGRVVVRGRELDVDCYAIRDRTWAPRPERWKDGRVGYCNAIDVEAGVAFLASSMIGDPEARREPVVGGYYVADGRRRRLVEGVRILERNPDHGYIERITVEGVDEDGRELSASGTSTSRMAMPIPGVHAVVWTSIIDWQVGGVQAWGEDQDAWPLHGWAGFRRPQLERAR